MSDLSGLKELVERAESLESDIKKLEDEKSKSQIIAIAMDSAARKIKGKR